MSSAHETLPPVNGGTRRLGLALMLVVFVLGLVCGAALSVIVIRSVVPARPMLARGHFEGFGPGDPGFDHMAERLGLNDEQRRRMREELDGTRLEVHRLLMESGERIRALLDDEQRRKFDEMREHRGMHMRQPGAIPRSKGPPAPPPDGSPP